MKKVISFILCILVVAGISGCNKQNDPPKADPAPVQKYIEFGGGCWANDSAQPMFPIEKTIDQKLPEKYLKMIDDIVAESLSHLNPSQVVDLDKNIIAARNFLFTSSFTYPKDESATADGSQKVLRNPTGVSKLISNVYDKSFDFYLNNMKENAKKKKTDLKTQIPGTLDEFKREITDAMAKCDRNGHELSKREFKLVIYFALQQGSAFSEDINKNVKILVEEAKITEDEAKDYMIKLLWLQTSSYSCDREMLTTLQENETFTKACRQINQNAGR